MAGDVDTESEAQGLEPCATKGVVRRPHHHDDRARRLRSRCREPRDRRYRVTRLRELDRGALEWDARPGLASGDGEGRTRWVLHLRRTQDRRTRPLGTTRTVPTPAPDQ